MKLSKLTQLDLMVFSIYLDNVKLRFFVEGELGIYADLWNCKTLVFKDQELSLVVGVPEGALIYDAVDTTGAKVNIIVKTLKVAYEDELEQ